MDGQRRVIQIEIGQAVCGGGVSQRFVSFEQHKCRYLVYTIFFPVETPCAAACACGALAACFSLQFKRSVPRVCNQRLH
jgi:hypothetical protein